MTDLYYQTKTVSIYAGDCRKVLPGIDPVDAVVCDPPYGLSFMGKGWDRGVPGVVFWQEIMSAMKPGAHLLAFGGTRTFHRLACAIEDAGLEIRDCVMWTYGTGFPKSLDVSKAIDKSRGGKKFEEIRSYLRERILASGVSHQQIKNVCGYPANSGVVGHWVGNSQPGIPGWSDWCAMRDLLDLDDRFDSLIRSEVGRTIGEKDSGLDKGSGVSVDFSGSRGRNERGLINVVDPATDAARQWDGWGTALKPAVEYVVCARKPLPEDAERVRILANLNQKAARLCLLLSDAELAAVLSESSLDVRELLDTARWSADERTSTRAALSAQTDTSRFESAVSTCLSTVTSWRDILAAAWKPGNTSTIETAIEPTTDYATLNFCLSEITLDSIIEAVMKQPGSWLNALPAAKYFNAVVTNIVATHELSALAPVIESEREKCPGEIDWDLRPDWRPIIVARKPLIGTVAANVLEHGTGGLNIDGCRVGMMTEKEVARSGRSTDGMFAKGGLDWKTEKREPKGRWPANLLHDGSDEVLERLGDAARFFYQAELGDEEWLDRNLPQLTASSAADPSSLSNVADAIAQRAVATGALLEGKTCAVSKARSTSVTASESRRLAENAIGAILTIAPVSSQGWPQHELSRTSCPVKVAVKHEPTGTTTITVDLWRSDGSADPVMFSITPPSSEAGDLDSASRLIYCAKASKSERGEGNAHPTVKPLALMRYLVRLVTPPGGVVLDPFMGSGSTLLAAQAEGFRAVGIDLEEQHCEIAKRRILVQISPALG